MSDWQQQVTEELKGIKDAVESLGRKTSGIFSWLVPWIAGWLFTLGACGTEETVAFLEQAGFWEKILAGIVTLGLWPAILGAGVFGQ